MLEIVICDKSKELVKNISDMLKELIEKNSLKANISFLTTTPDKVELFFRSANGVYFALLDIVFGNDHKGIDIALNLRERSRESYIVFLSECIDVMQKVFRGQLRPSGFLIKPIESEDIKDSFYSAYSDYLNHYEKDNVFTVNIGAKLYKVPLKKILFFEAAEKKIFINTANQRVGYYDSLESIEERLKESSFHRCHKGFIVNEKHVERADFSQMSMYMTNGGQIPISRTYKDQMKKILC